MPVQISCRIEKQMQRLSCFANRQCKIGNQKLFTLGLCVAVATLFVLAGCEAERRKSDAELGLNPRQAAGRRVYDQYCNRCHEPYSSRGKKGPSMKGVFKKQYLPLSGLPANDDRVGEIIRYGRSKMQGFDQVLSQQQIENLLAYLHTL
jgi:mono/diheme cytochrome c family protein